MKHSIRILLLFLFSSTLMARTLEVRSGGTYTNLEAAAAAAMDGDTILFRGGVYAGGEHVSNLQGSSTAWITIMAAPGEEVILRGGTNAWQLSDPAYLRISGFVLEEQTGNGLNIDDGGSYETPAHHLIIEHCTWRGIDATGNNDLMKLSGLDTFEVRDCIFRDGAAGGSMIDMVGCHEGLFTRNTFTNGGSNSIQAKGGTSNITIERNTFVNGGQRAINIGGSTGLEFFRPLGINYESSNIDVYSNTFVGSDAPIAYVGTVNSSVVNNTIYTPGRWAIRILQETTAPGFLQCGDNTFSNNIVVVGSAVNTTVNVGPNTRPETFTFSNNLWYNIDNPNWSPSLPVTETNGITRRDPMLTAPPADMTLRSGSPAIGAGASVNAPMFDYLGRPFATPRSIGAVEGNQGGSSSIERSEKSTASFSVMLHSGSGRAEAIVALPVSATIELALYDMQGKLRWSREEDRVAGEVRMDIPLGDLASGLYFCVLRQGGESTVRPIVVRR